MREYTKYCISGVENIKLKNYETAIDCFNKAIELKPDYYIAYRERGLAKYYLNIEQRKNNNHLNNSFKKAFQLIENGSFNNVCNHDNAKKDINRAIELNPNDYKAYFYVAKMSGKVMEANVYFDKAIKLNPHFLNAYCEKYELNADYRSLDIAVSTQDEMKRNNSGIKIYISKFLQSKTDCIYKDFGYYINLIKEIKEYEKYSK